MRFFRITPLRDWWSSALFGNGSHGSSLRGQYSWPFPDREACWSRGNYFWPSAIVGSLNESSLVSWIVMGTIRSWSGFARSVVCSITSIIGVSRSDHDRAEHPWSDRFARLWVLLNHARPLSSITLLEHLGSWPITLLILVIEWCDELI